MEAEDLTQLYGYLPKIQESSVLILGADSETVESFTKKAAKVTSSSKAEFPNEKFDIVHMDSVFDGITEEASLELIEKCVGVLKVGGFLSYRQKCAQLSHTETHNASTPSYYIDLTQLKTVKEADPASGETSADFGFDLIYASPSRNCQNNNEVKVAFLFTKVKLGNHHGHKTMKEFIDAKQYTINGVLRYEKIFGEGFVSTGGLYTTEHFLAKLDLKPGQRVLDVGCGIGGGDFLMAEKYGVEVIGADLSANMVSICWDRAAKYSHLKTKFEIADVCKQIFPNGFFDVIYSRDTILHIEDKKSLFARFKDWLKPGGKVFITDYCCGPKELWTEEYAAYVASRGYFLLEVPQYGDLFTQLGFQNVKAIDETKLFVECLDSELVKFDQIKNNFVNEFSEEDFKYLVDGWNAKKVRCAAGCQRWGSFYCEKP